MNIIDVLVGIPLLWAAYKGFSKGLIVEVATLLALVLGIYGALHFSDFTANFIRERLNYDSKYMSYIAFVVTFLLIAFGINLSGRFLNRFVEIIALGPINRLLGALFALMKVALILSILVNLADRLDERFNFISVEKKEKSLLYKPLNKLALRMYDFFDFDFGATKKKLEENYDSLIEV